MTTPSSTTTPEASTVLGPDPDRASGGAVTVDGAASLQETLDEVHAEMVAAAESEESSLDQPTVGAYRDEDGRVHYASPYSKATGEHLAAGEWTAIDPNEPPFDPTGQRVRDVIAYLEEHAGSQVEIDRVKTAEAAGEDRPTIRDWTPDA